MTRRIYLLAALLAASFLFSYAQKTVDLSEIIFEETDNKAFIYKQFSARTVLATETDADQMLKFDLGAGSAAFYASATDELKVEAEIVLSIKNDKNIGKEVQDLELYIEEKGDEIKLVSTFDYSDEGNETSKSFFSSPERKVNLKIFVPTGRSLKILDRSGDLSIKDLSNNVVLTDGSGGITISGLEGNLRMVDHSGGITVQDVNMNGYAENDIYIKDYSGGLYVSNIRGNTEIIDSSGDVELKGVSGNLRLRDSSGGIRIRNVVGDAKVSDSSGDISIVNVDGNVTISDASGGIYVKDITQDVTLKRDGSGSFTTKNVQGKIIARN